MAIIDKIGAGRSAVMRMFFDDLNGLLDTYQGGARQCLRNENCDAMALGSLIRGLVSANLYPLPDPSSIRISINELLSTMGNMKLTSLCKTMYCSSPWISHSCDLEGKIEDMLDYNLETSTAGPSFESSTNRGNKRARTK